MMAARSPWLTCLAVMAVAGAARGEAAHPPVVLALASCAPPLEEEVRRIVGVELRAAVVDAARTPAATTRVFAACRGTEVDLLLANTASAKHLQRTVVLSEATPLANARLIALAVAELVVVSWQESESGPDPTASLERPPPPVVVRASAGAGASGMVQGIGVVRALPASGLWSWGAGVRGTLTLVRPLTLLLELDAEWGTASRKTGQVATRALGGALGLGWRIETSWGLVLPWAAARAGVQRLAGEPGPAATETSGGVVSGPWLGPELGALVVFFPRARVHATVALAVGEALFGVRGDVTGDRTVDMRGPWAALAVGVGLAKR
jgi:hypothetical protein